MKINKIEGLLAATFSTFDDNKALKLSLVPKIVEKLIADGIKGIFVGGTNGEGLSLSTEERMAVTEAYVAASNKRVLIFTHVGHSSITEARKLAAHAQKVGADAISAVSAFYFKPQSAENLADCMAQIASAAPHLPFYYYHIPSVTGLSVSVIDFLKHAEAKIPNLAGVKYTANTLHEYQDCLNYKNGKFDILFGYDELLLPVLTIGAKAAIGSTYCFAAPMYLQVMELFNQRKIEEAAAAHFECVKMIRALAKYPPIPTQKEILRMTGLDLGGCRLPLVDLNETQCSELEAYLNEISFLIILTMPESF
ncbi:dihydrodipicolinate synthase family protein [Niabella ginsengisoli]|uniref:Dihydrodipicolinate synthase family protein n=1 Tax=Niabella ginsengisoli TaxID=522298 RepID=A0ABS9SN71_9BACT|nr:dihydrodipicolinate synthase family protein [Niabella ginsengisoli]MCH5599833.1 dihydrodipicolinate synthase family protein [Niabella ginsengisoli]